MTLAQFARETGYARVTVLSWIKSGRLEADLVPVAGQPKPVYQVDAARVAEFKRARSAKPRKGRSRPVRVIQSSARALDQICADLDMLSRVELESIVKRLEAMATSIEGR